MRCAAQPFAMVAHDGARALVDARAARYVQTDV
jgi:hypothetical protein